MSQHSSDGLDSCMIIVQSHIAIGFWTISLFAIGFVAFAPSSSVATTATNQMPVSAFVQAPSCMIMVRTTNGAPHVTSQCSGADGKLIAESVATLYRPAMTIQHERNDLYRILLIH